MNTPLNAPVKPASHHPMMILAAVAIILFCLAGTAAIMGWIPSSFGGKTSSGELTASDRAALASSLTDSNGNGMNVGNTGVEAQRERDRLAQLDRDTVSQRERNGLAARAPAQPAYREASYQEPMRLAQADTRPVHKVCSNCGRVDSVRAIKTRAQGSGVGAAGGAILGGLLGHQIGGGNGKKLATVAGAVGGAVVGNQVEGNMKATTSYEVHVRMDNGASRTFHLQNLNGYNSGDRIKVVNGALHHAG
ncbi:glycine zipper 2TM domain-containing protein [Massilia sp. TWP1-3-3]|uniref:glycine zipper 2TM domain-containing protein n=1 Tax=Massilia sp. TWP1-3-3 TaxID=2804573 RepID=UPI003CEA1B43